MRAIGALRAVLWKLRPSSGQSLVMVNTANKGKWHRGSSVAKGSKEWGKQAAGQTNYQYDRGQDAYEDWSPPKVFSATMFGLEKLDPKKLTGYQMEKLANRCQEMLHVLNPAQCTTPTKQGEKAVVEDKSQCPSAQGGASTTQTTKAKDWAVKWEEAIRVLQNSPLREVAGSQFRLMRQAMAAMERDMAVEEARRYRERSCTPSPSTER